MAHFSKLSRDTLEDLDRRLQEELASLEREKRLHATEEADPRLRARREFEELRREYKLTVADVLTFFPESESVAYLTELIDRGQVRTPMKLITRTNPS